jgi:hypothetical protein
MDVRRRAGIRYWVDARTRLELTYDPQKCHGNLGGVSVDYWAASVELKIKKGIL